MGKNFEELDYRPSNIGDISLRRRRIPGISDTDVFEVKLGDEFLMSSLFTDGEIALANHGLAALKMNADVPVDVVVGGLGLGYTAHAALKFGGVGSLVVVDALAPVIDWHQKGLVPLGRNLISDSRCQLVHGDFFVMAGADGAGFDPKRPGRQFDAVLLDIDHSPQKLLDPTHGPFYTPTGLKLLAKFIRPNGVFALWSNDLPSDQFSEVLSNVFTAVKFHVVNFQNPMTGENATSTIYVAATPRV